MQFSLSVTQRLVLDCCRLVSRLWRPCPGVEQAVDAETTVKIVDAGGRPQQSRHGMERDLMQCRYASIVIAHAGAECRRATGPGRGPDLAARLWPSLGKCVEAIDRLDPFGTESRV
jgi:hypothetical protein